MLVFHDLMYNRLDFLLSLPVRVGISFAHKKHREFSQLAVNTQIKKYVLLKILNKGTEFIGNGKTKYVFIILIFVNEF